MPSFDYQKKIKQEFLEEKKRKQIVELFYNFQKNIVQNVEIESFGLIFSLK